MHQTALLSSPEAPLEFRVLHYLGSKLRVIGAIRRVIGNVLPDGGRVCDLFSGSGAVSVGLRHAWSVTAIDIQEYSRVLCNALLNPASPLVSQHDRISDLVRRSELRARLMFAVEPLITYERETLEASASGSMDRLCELVENGSLFLAASNAAQPRSSTALMNAQYEVLGRLATEGLDDGELSVISRYFGGVYFSWQQAVDLDALLDVAHSSDSTFRDQMLAPVLSVASDIVNTVGKQFAQPLRPRDSEGRPKLHLIRQTIRDRSMDVLDLYETWLERFASIPSSPHEHSAIRGDFMNVLDERIHSFDLVYADPPYTRDHYSRYYHVLETMALRDEPKVSTTTIRTGGAPMPSRGIYREDRHQSPFCIKSKAPGAFDALFSKVAEARKPLLLSYSPYKESSGNRPRLLTVSELSEIAQRHYDRVEVADVDGVIHNKFNVNERNVTVDYAAEILMLCRQN